MIFYYKLRLHYNTKTRQDDSSVSGSFYYMYKSIMLYKSIILYNLRQASPRVQTPASGLSLSCQPSTLT